MIVATTHCCDCGDEIELDDEYGWTKEDQDKKRIVCDNCENASCRM